MQLVIATGIGKAQALFDLMQQGYSPVTDMAKNPADGSFNCLASKQGAMFAVRVDAANNVSATPLQ